jgi:protein-arginine kinase activator protein McsA
MLRRAVRQEQYEEAAKLRDQIQSLQHGQQNSTGA